MAHHDACRRLLKGDDGNLDDDEIEVLVTAYAQNFKLASDKAWNFNATRDAKELQEKAKSTSDICAASLKKLHIGKCHDGKTKLFGEFADVGDKTALHEQYPRLAWQRWTASLCRFTMTACKMMAKCVAHATAKM